MPSIGDRATAPIEFTCPRCGVQHDGELTTTITATPVKVPSRVELWPGGPMVEDDSATTPRYVVGDRQFATSACSCVFDLRYYNVIVTTYPRRRTLVDRLLRRPAGIARTELVVEDLFPANGEQP